MIFFCCFCECILHMLLWYKNTVLLSLHRNYIKFIRATRRNSWLVHVSYKYTEQTCKQYHRILLDFPQILSLLFQFLLLFFCLHVLFKLRIYILIHDYAGGWVVFTRSISGNKTTFLTFVISKLTVNT